jgi:hypothetical protein
MTSSFCCCSWSFCRCDMSRSLSTWQLSSCSKGMFW